MLRDTNQKIMRKNRIIKHLHISHGLLLIGGGLLVASITLFAPHNEVLSRAVGVETIVTMTNESRALHNEAPLTVNTQLMSAAQQKAEDMVQQRYFAHFSPSNKSPWDFFRESGYTYAVAGENLAITNENESAVISGWINSPTHKENMLNSQYQDIGIGIATYGTYQDYTNTTVIVALYGTPMSAVAASGSEPTNPAGAMTLLSRAPPSAGVYAAVSAASAFIIAAIALELRHLHRTKSHHTIA